MPVNIDTLIVGPFEVNCYLVVGPESRSAVVIDPGADPERIVNRLKRIGVDPMAILLTHAHGDHIGGIQALQEQFRLPLYCGKGEDALLEDPERNMSSLIGEPIAGPKPDRLLEDEEQIHFGNLKFTVLATPGHSPGGVCYLMESEGALFCGDTLFYGSIGRTDFPGCSLEQLLGSIKRKIMTLPDGIRCYPGHGPATTVGAERVNNPFLTGAYFA